MQDENLSLSFEKKCYSWSHSWFLRDGQDSTLIKGVSLGLVMQLWVFEKLFESSQVNADGLDFRSILKRLNFEWTARSLWGFFVGRSNKSQSEYLLIYDVNNDPMINALNRIGLSLEQNGCSVGAVTVDSNIAKKCAVSNKISWFAYFSWTEFLSGIKSFSTLRKAFFGGLSQVLPALAKEFGAGKAKAVERYFKCQGLQLSFEVMSLCSLLNHNKSKVVILASDAHRVSRQIVFLCRQLGIKTVVYQHGATIWEYGYVPVFADRMLVWGEASRRWFQQRDVPASKLIEVGNLQADMLPIPQLQSADFQRPRKIFFFPNPIDRDVTRNVLLAFMDLCSRFNSEGVVKLHPSERNVDFFESTINGSNSNLVISRASMADAGVMPGDIAVIVNSTAGIDCCIYGAYVLNIAVDSMPNPVDYESGGVGIRSGLDDYVEKFERLLLLPVSDYILARENFIRDHLGPLDGKALQRVSDEILNY